MSTDITTAIAEYNPIAAVLAELTKRHEGVVFDVTQPSGMKAAKFAKAEIAQYRIALEKERVKLKADVLERGRLIDGEAKRIGMQLAALEDPIEHQIKSEERRIEAERQAAIRAEEERLAAIERAKKEAEERRLAEERAKIDAEREALEREKTAQRLLFERALRDREEADRQARLKIEAEERAARARIEEEERAARRARDAEEARLKAERDRIDAERRAIEDGERRRRQAEEDAARAAREKAETEERERRRQKNEKLEAREMLIAFKERFGHLIEFETVVEEIDACLAVGA